MISDLFHRPPQCIYTQRCVLIHVHIFKNAGTTFDWILENNFKDSFEDHRDDDAMRKGGQDYLETYITKHDTISALSSHHIREPLPSPSAITLLPVIFLRHPVLRAKSVYTFERRQKSDTPGAQHAKKYDFADYISWRMQKGVGRTIRDSQTNICSRVYTSASPIQLSNARAFLDQCVFMGVVERFDESMILFEDHIKNFFAGIDLTYIVQNAQNSAGYHNVSEQINSVLKDMGANRDAFLENNRQDDALYAYANTLLDNRLTAIDNFDQKLSDFQHRNHQKQGKPRG